MATSRDQLLQSAEKHVAKGRLDQALKDYLRVLDDHPKDIATLNKTGDLYVRMNRPTDSIPFFTRIADLYSRDGFFLKAIAIYKKINKIDPARLEVYDRLAELYHKQGLTQDARSQYQVLADHYSANNKPDEAIAAYKKMAAVDPNDLKIHVRLADLYRARRQLDQAVMQYGLIGSMLLRRGAHDEAAAVFQKALELSPGDAGILKSLVRSLLAQSNPTAAISVLRAAPRTPESLALLAEAQLDLGSKGDAIRSVEQALALDASNESARVLLCRMRLAEGASDAALSAVLPVVDAAVGRRDFAHASGLLSPILQGEPAHRASLKKLAEVRAAEGNTAESARLWLAAAREEERRGETGSAIESYQRVVEKVPGEPDALARLAELAPGAGGAERLAPPRAVGREPAELVIDLDISARPPAATEPTALPQPPSPASLTADQEVEALVVEAEVFAKYGLIDKAIERLRALARKRPDLLRARERLVELLKESQNATFAREAEALARVYRDEGRSDQAETLLARLGLTAAAAPTGAVSFPPAPPAAAEVPFDEFELALPPPDSVAEVAEKVGTKAGHTSEIAPFEVAGPSSSARPTPLEGSVDSDFVSYEELGSLLEEEMHKAGEMPPATARPPAIDEQSLFADEQQFFNLAEELEKELADEAPAPPAPVMAGREGREASLEEIFREFKKGVEQQLSAEDYETHFNLGIAYKEMGLIDEAIGEFQLASKDPGRAVECCSMLGLCFLEKGMPQLAVKWYRKGLDAPDIKEMETAGLLYDLGCIYQSTGESDLAYRTFLEVYGLNTNYRDVVHRVKDLEAVRKN